MSFPSVLDVASLRPSMERTICLRVQSIESMESSTLVVGPVSFEISSLLSWSLMVLTRSCKAENFDVTIWMLRLTLRNWIGVVGKTVSSFVSRFRSKVAETEESCFSIVLAEEVVSWLEPRIQTIDPVNHDRIASQIVDCQFGNRFVNPVKMVDKFIDVILKFVHCFTILPA